MCTCAHFDYFIFSDIGSDLGQFSAIYESCFPVVKKEWEKLEIVGVGVTTYEVSLKRFRFFMSIS